MPKLIFTGTSTAIALIIILCCIQIIMMHRRRRVDRMIDEASLDIAFANYIVSTAEAQARRAKISGTTYVLNRLETAKHHMTLAKDRAYAELETDSDYVPLFRAEKYAKSIEMLSKKREKIRRNCQAAVFLLIPVMRAALEGDIEKHIFFTSYPDGIADLIRSGLMQDFRNRNKHHYLDKEVAYIRKLIDTERRIRASQIPNGPKTKARDFLYAAAQSLCEVSEICSRVIIRQGDAYDPHGPQEQDISIQASLKAADFQLAAVERILSDPDRFM